jgi:predicted P-loop ATPase
MPILPTASDLKRRLVDPVRLCELLGLAYRREGGGAKISCPWHSEQNPDCSVTLGPDGTIRVHCFACGGGGDALSLIAQVRGLDIKADFKRVVQEAADLLGERALANPAPPPRQREAKARPPAGEVAQLWSMCLKAGAEADAFARRGIVAAELEQLDLVRVLPQVAALPRWAVCKKRSWGASGHRFITPMYGPSGSMESVRARSLSGGEPKALPPAGCRVGGLVLADPAGQQLLRTGRAPAGGVLICEGEPDFWTLATHWSDADPAAPAVLGIVNGGWSDDIAARIPDGTSVLIWMHTDRPKAPRPGAPERPGAGDAYAASLRRSLGARCTFHSLFIPLPDGADKAPDANDLLLQGGRAAITQVLVDAVASPLDPDAWRDQLLYDRVRGEMKLRRCLANVVTIFGQDPRWRGVLAWNEFQRSLEALKTPPWDLLDAPQAGAVAAAWSDSDDARSVAWLDRYYHLTVGKEMVRDGMRVAAEQRRYHPVRRYLESLRWDGFERLPTLFSAYFGDEDRPYLRQVGLWWPISAVARIYDPGCKVDTAIILEGKQGKRKSSALGVLAVEQSWFFDSTLPIGDKGAYELLRGKWIVEFAELESWKKADHRKLKSFLSSRQDTFRESYGYRSADFLRQCVFAGSTNEGQYIEDSTGGRRFLPVRCVHIFLDELRRDRDQIWAEAVVRYKRGERWWPQGPEEEALCQAEQDERYEPDPWEEIIADWLDRAEGADRLAVSTGQLTTGLVMAKAIGLSKERSGRLEESRCGAVLRRLGFERRRQRVGGNVKAYFYVRSETSGNGG